MVDKKEVISEETTSCASVLQIIEHFVATK